MTTNDIDAIRKLVEDALGIAQQVDLAEHVPALCDETEQLRAEKAKMRATIEAFEETHGNAVYLAANLAAVRNERDEFAAELEKVRAQLTAANHHADGLTADLRTLQQANTAYANENAELKAELATANAKLAILVLNPEVAR